MSGGQIVTSLLILAVAVAVYFLPMIVAGGRKHQSWGGIFVVNLFFGWTLLGWVVALAWALSWVRRQPELEIGKKSKICPNCGRMVPMEAPMCGGCNYDFTAPPHPADKTCPKCAETIKATAVICRFCGHDFEHPNGPPKTPPAYRESV